MQERYRLIAYAVRIAVYRCFSADRLIREIVKVRQHEAISALGMDRCLRA